MANPNPQTPYTKDSEQIVLNKSFDPTYDILAVELAGEYSNTLKRLQTDSSGNLKISGTITAGKPTDAYSIQAISDDGTYTYYFFEDASANYYIMRKTQATKIFEYTKGTGGYSSVYQSSILGPSGSPTWDDYGATF